MQNLRICWNNLWDSGTLTFNSEETNFLASRTQHRWATKCYRATGVTGGLVGDEMISNGSFLVDIDPPTSWDPLNSAILSTEAGGQDGNCLMITEGGELNPSAIQNPITVTAGETYTFSFYVKQGTESTFTVWVYDVSNGASIWISTGEAGAGWTQYTHTFEAPAGCSVIYVRLFQMAAPAAGTTIYYDEISLHEAGEWLKLDTGLVNPGIQAFIVKISNFTDAAGTVLELNATDEWEGHSPTYSEVLTPDTSIMVHFPTSTQNLRWSRFTMADGANPDTYVKVGRIFLGGYWSPEINFTRQYRKTPVDPSLITFSEGGQISSIQRPHYTEYVYAFKRMSAADKASLEAIFADRGLAKDFFICQDADGVLATTTYQARFAKNIVYDHVIRDEQFDVVIYVEELR